jgi:hypothetical protein
MTFPPLPCQPIDDELIPYCASDEVYRIFLKKERTREERQKAEREEILMRVSPSSREFFECGFQPIRATGTVC